MNAQLVTGFSTNEDGRQLFMLGLTDEMIENIKKSGGALQTAESNGQGIDIAILYAPGLNELVTKIKRVNKGETEVRFV